MFCPCSILRRAKGTERTRSRVYSDETRRTGQGSSGCWPGGDRSTLGLAPFVDSSRAPCQTSLVAIDTVSHSFVDVVENALGLSASDDDIMRLERRHVEDLAARLLEFYDTWSPPVMPANSVRVFVEQPCVPWIDWHPGMPFPLPPLLPLLYVDALVIEDPVSGSVEAMLRGPGVSHWTLVQRTLASALVSFRYCRALLADGSLVLAPQGALREGSTARADGLCKVLGSPRSRYEDGWRDATMLAEDEIRNVAAELFPDVLRTQPARTFDLVWTDAGTFVQAVSASTTSPGGQTTIEAAFETSWRLTNSVIRSMCSASSVSASLLPGSIYADATHRAILESLASVGASVGDEVTRVIPALLSGRLPAFIGVPPKTIVEIRRTEPAFDAWRSELRNAVRLIRGAPATPGFAAEASRVLDDALLPKMDELHNVASTIGRAKAGARGATVGFTIGAVTAAARGGSGLGSGLLAAGAGSAANLAFEALFPARDSGIRNPLLRLMPYHRANQGIRS
jgi:hypothetical protein